MPAHRLIAHRGASARAPENTLAAIRKAAELGAGWVEFDVKLTRDGAAVLLHDDRLERTTDGHGPVAACDLGELRRLDAGSWFAPAFAGEPVPTLAEAVAACRALGLAMNVEIKPCPGRARATADAVAAALRALPETEAGRVLVSSFRAECLRRVADLVPALPRALLIWDLTGDPAGLAASLGCVAINPRQICLNGPQPITAWKAAGFAVFPFTVNDRARARELLNWGADGFFTDEPALLAGAGGQDEAAMPLPVPDRPAPGPAADRRSSR